ncbi:hypothetical protein HY972_02000, partial [Candidatus Kaiserbacteria bacterium]|nr:hypothetical protein [Candidatus Kaiserbacteria bacterium]
AKDAELTKAEAAIDPASVANFLRLRDRLSLGNALLGKHPAFSGFFTSLGTLLPTTVRFSSFHVTLDSSGMARIEGSGVAKNFNALAAASTAFADDGRVKDAVFSKMTIGKDNSVSFGLSATLDPKLIVFSPEAATQPPPAASDAPTTPSP